MIDLQSLVPRSQQYGDLNTFSGFTAETSRKRIDFIFLSKAKQAAEEARSNACWLAKGYSVIPNRFEDGVYNSDHQAVVGDLELI